MTYYQNINNYEEILSKDNLVCVYRNNDDYSFSIAKKYADIYKLNNNQIIGINCSNIEILPSYETFLDEIENPILQALSDSSRSFLSVYAIVLMPFVPGGFLYNNNIISSTSRLSKIYHNFSYNIYNNLYNRQSFNKFNGEDALSSLICTRIDGPESVVENWIDNIKIAKDSLNVNGRFYFDAYSNYNFNESVKYNLDLLDFADKYKDLLGLEFIQTSKPATGKDAFFSKIESDSFFWGWGADLGSISFFRQTPSIRGFFYNADLNGARSIRDINSRSWPLLAIRQNYIATAGSLGATDATSFLRPSPFFNCLFKGGTLGESFLYSQPKLNSNICCFGDPLSNFIFPSSVEIDTSIDPDFAWSKMQDYYSKSISYLYRKSSVLKDLRQYTLTGSEESFQLKFVYLIDDLSKEFNDFSWKNTFIILTNKFINFYIDRNSTSLPFFYPSLNQYLSYSGNKISSLILETYKDNNIINSLEDKFLYKVGSWYFEDILINNMDDFRFFNFELEVAETLQDLNDGNLIFKKDSFEDSSNWFYEDENSNFKPIASSGITSNFAGKKIRYISKDNETLVRGNFYWFRFRQKDELFNFPWRYYKNIIYQ